MITVDPSKNLVYVSNISSVNVIDGQTNNVMANLYVGHIITAISIDGKNSLYVGYDDPLTIVVSSIT
ncbi:hypothetical protein [Candidatus Nitrosotalea okcheonensis]|uniref:YncE family protein n=1 Tax=Candidatus Nitrosotalea okcheonensis TaxID=1903276 RepID=A0A2H1FHY6_9ARCH|nr:hypothetical protein [Candidatus Nitrosotalea okcheonensis]SMH72302.1 protein of unknown function [Candidatus Nitrosotalea okcheonensis]